MTPNAIRAFRGPYAFLSNFAASPMTMQGIPCATAEHAYQGSKAVNSRDRRNIMSAPTAAEAKRRGRQVALPNNWEIARVPLMAHVLRVKFQQNPEMGRQLAETGHALLVEGNTWHDQFWGDCRCPEHRDVPGENQLGKLLMELRIRLQAEIGIYTLDEVRKMESQPMKGTSMKAQEIKDVITLSELLSDHGYDEVCRDPDVLAALMDWKGNGAMSQATAPAAPTPAPVPPKRGRPAKAAPVKRAPAPEPTPDPSEDEVDF